MKKNDRLKESLSRFYFWFENYDNFNYSAPPWSTLLIIINILFFIFFISIDMICIFLDRSITCFVGKSNLLIIVYVFSLFLLSTIMSIILISNNKKIYKRMMLLAGKDYLNSLWMKRKKQPLVLKFILYFFFLFVPLIINCFIISQLCD